MIHIETIKPKLSFLLLKLPNSFWCALGLVFGITLAHCHPWLILPSLCLPFFISKKPNHKALKGVLFILIGYGAYTYHTQSKMPAPALENTFVTGKITDKTFADNSFWKHRTRLEVSKIKTNHGWLPCAFSLYIYSRKRVYGRVQDVIECGPLNIKTPTDKGFALYLQREGVSATSFPQQLHYKIQKRPKFSFLNWIFWQRELLQIKLRKKLSPKAFSLFSSLFIGNRKPVTALLASHKQGFKKWGILHHLARSGLHLVVFIMIWHYLLNILPLSFIYKHAIISFLLLFYFLFSWSSLSFLRAFIIYALYKAGTLTQSKVHPLHTVCSACLLLLIHNPFHLFFLDFQLSFLLSFFLLWIAHVDHQRNILRNKSLAEKKAKTLS